jgi:hypothetical protein
MDDSDFDRLTRRFSRHGLGAASRRGFLAAAAGALAGLAHRSASAIQLESPPVQLGPSTCGAAGAVCTLLVGCCDGLTCVTSAINANYGVCMPGDGGTVAVGTTLVSPGSEEVAQEIASGAPAPTTTTTTTTDTTSTTTTSDTQAERDARQADRDTRRQARQDRQQTRRDTKRANQRSNRLARKARQGPSLQLEYFPPDGTRAAEVVKVTNNADSTVVLNSIGALHSPTPPVGLSTLTLQLAPRDSFLFRSGDGPTESDPSDGQITWNEQKVCGEAGQGFVIQAAFSTDFENHDYVIRCDQSLVANNPNQHGGKHKGHKKRGRGHGKKNQ